jgi:hypothetical protein
MIDFLVVSTRSSKRGVIEIYPKFIIKKSSDLMIRGGDFYAIWIEERGLWSTDEQDALQLIDRELEKFAEENRHKYDSDIKILHMWDAGSGMIDAWHKYCQKQMRDSFHMLDDKLIFSNTNTNKKDYASKKLTYPLEPGDMSAYDKLMSILYTEEERHKIEWAIGSIVSGESKKLQKFMVLYGAAGTGKSTVLNIIQHLFEGYYSVFDAKALGSSSNSFALEAFKSNPLVAIQHDGDLSKIEDNTRLNSLVSHELMTVNEKFKSTYANQFKCFLFMGTNKPVKITDAKSGLIRRLIDVSPSGNKLDTAEYKTIVKRVIFELGAIAYHCQELYLKNPSKYDDYVPLTMLGASNDFYNFVIDSYYVFKTEDGTTMKAAWEMYKTYCDEAKVTFPFSQRIFKEELKNYFREYKERFNSDDGSRFRSYYSGFRTDKFEDPTFIKKEEIIKPSLITFKNTKSIFDKACADCPAQYASSKEIPSEKWDNTKTILSQLDTSKIHYVKPPLNHIVIDFDIQDDNGNKSLERNIEEASKWPLTYAELSKSGNGIHLHYIYTGDPTELSCVFDDYIEIKVFVGKSSLRRKLSKCNDVPIATISSGLPLKGEKKMVNFESINTEKRIRTIIKRNLNKEIHPATKPSIDFIYKILEDAYNQGIHYDVTDMRNAVIAFAASSSHQADYCLKFVSKMKFKSDDQSINIENKEAVLVFYDIEIFQNLFICCWKIKGIDKPVVRMINPKPSEIEELLKFKLIGFNCRRYDNHILYARMIGYSNEQLYELSQKIVSGSSNGFFGEAYNISYTDVYDFASAGNKKGLKKFEIELGLRHQELGLPWDQPVSKELWTKVAEYCDNDVIATEAVFDYLTGDWTARQILADIAGLTVNDTTNTLTTKIIFGDNKKPQSQFNYRNMGLIPDKVNKIVITEDNWVFDNFGDEYSLFDDHGRPVFPSYKYENGKSTYRGENVGEGGYVHSVPGMHGNVALLDVVSMHPSSVIAEELFGPVYTAKFKEIVDARIAVKHEKWDKVKNMLNGKLNKYIQKVVDGEMTSKDLANALKTAINSVYGLTSASFENAFNDSRNKDNIVAKRGALFMINLKHEVKARGYIVAHIKTDSIKIPDADPKIIQFVMDYGKQYGYDFEHEATYDKMCLVNDAVYIAKYASKEKCESLYGYCPGDNKKHSGEWTATGTQFAVPYVFKKLFSGESIEFEDVCETKSVTSSLYLDMNESLPDVSELEKTRDRLAKKDPPMSADGLDEQIQQGHNYKFVGKVGRFCPVKPGCGGGILLRETTNTKTGEKSYAAATGSKGYRWLESEMVKELGKETDVDRTYYDHMVNDAVKALNQHGDVEWFTSEDSYDIDNNGIFPF